MSQRYAYLGPEGTFTEAALREHAPGPADARFVPMTGVAAVLDAVRAGDAEAGMVPLENSVEGGVNATIDELVNGEPLQITAEVALPVEFSLLAAPGTRLADIKRVVTHPHALAQCRGWLRAELPEAQTFTAASTAAAAHLVAEPGSSYDAAIAARIAGERYGLAAVAVGIGDHRDAVTRFVLVRRPEPPGEPTGADRTSLVAFIRDDHPGALLEILSEFAVRGVNLTRIESRPTGHGLGRYCFCIDAEGHVREARVAEALMGLRRICSGLRFLGSYPRADGGRPELRPGTSDADYTSAESWLSAVREGRR
ncbi:prephenate dehydratase [Allonocardiopsis opalescens]|uniref:Prephenate dehydratase n=1 Tax=Allonocardiopsis opalescens TaxID=1144618 RepID=A0A2T0Q716_9ACTN|nr:prephenate dehydratase [Allonocardiopsis opalescens]PRX99617.1 prephenate dehydratase [Allonocardiopsis opalescens]